MERGALEGDVSLKAVTIHAARDLRIDEAPLGKLGEKQVEIGVSVGGIWVGSPLLLHGEFGTVRLREPMILGHEVAGVVETVGAGVARVKAGDLILRSTRASRVAVANTAKPTFRTTTAIWNSTGALCASLIFRAPSAKD